jgi:hypothetical protein
MKEASPASFSAFRSDLLVDRMTRNGILVDEPFMNRTEGDFRDVQVG